MDVNLGDYLSQDRPSSALGLTLTAMIQDMTHNLTQQQTAMKQEQMAMMQELSNSITDILTRQLSQTNLALRGHSHITYARRGVT